MHLAALWWKKYTYCKTCDEVRPLDTIRCPICHLLVKRTPFSNKVRHKDFKYIE